MDQCASASPRWLIAGLLHHARPRGKPLAKNPGQQESFKRLTDLLDEPEAIEVLAPLVKREIHYRLLTSGSRSACSQSSKSWPCSHPRPQNISNARRAISRSVRPVALSSAGVLDSVAGIAITLVLVSLRFFAITSSFTTSHLTIVPPR
jgi:hypothetical protein